MTGDRLGIVLADDSALIRDGIAGLLERQGFDIVARVADADTLVACVDDLASGGRMPDLLVTDVRMPPTLTRDGLVAALTLRSRHPALAIVVLSQYVSPAYARRLFAMPSRSGTGYLLKDRVSDVAAFTTSLRVVADGGVVVDPDVTRAMMHSQNNGLDALTPRELEVISLAATGLGNRELARTMRVSEATVKTHLHRIFTKLDVDSRQAAIAAAVGRGLIRF